VDDSLLEKIPSGTEIHRPFFYDYRKIVGGDIARLLAPLLNRVYFPDKYVQWNHFAFKYIAKKILPFSKIDLIYTSLGPHSTMLLAHKLKQRFNIPMVVDFRDPFSFSQYNLLDEKKSSQSKAEKVERSVFTDADHIINVSRLWKEKYEHLYPDIVPKSSLIHNGYDEGDFGFSNTSERNDHFTLGYNGTFSRLVPLEPLLAALTEISQKHGASIRLNIASPTSKRKLTASFPHLFEKGLIEYKGFLPHAESLQYLQRSDVTVLILNDMEATEGMIPAKTFEYLRIGKPILLLHRKDSVLSEIIQGTQTGLTVDIADHDEIIKALLLLQDQWKQNKFDVHPVQHEIEQFERRHLTRQLADIFDALV
jgi:glycosyltransferase involved in cell wall biosynthesis